MDKKNSENNLLFHVVHTYLLAHNQKKVPGHVLKYIKWISIYSMKEY